MLRLLARYRITATFSMIGIEVQAYPAVARSGHRRAPDREPHLDPPQPAAGTRARDQGPLRPVRAKPRPERARWLAALPPSQVTVWPPRWSSGAARAHAVVVSVLTPAEILIAARRLAGARPHLAAVAGIVHHEDLWQLCRDELTAVDVRTGGWDIRGRWFGVVAGATPRTRGVATR